MFELVVTRHFGHYTPGQRITDPSEIAAALSEYAASVVRVAALPNEPAEVVTEEAPQKPARARVKSPE